MQWLLKQKLTEHIPAAQHSTLSAPEEHFCTWAVVEAAPAAAGRGWKVAARVRAGQGKDWAGEGRGLEAASLAQARGAEGEWLGTVGVPQPVVDGCPGAAAKGREEAGRAGDPPPAAEGCPKVAGRAKEMERQAGWGEG